MEQYTLVKSFGNKILHCGYDENGKKFIRKEDFQPSVFIETTDKSDFVTLYGKNVREKTFSDVREYRSFVKENRSHLNLYGTIDPAYQFIRERYQGEQFTPKETNILYIDIEVLSKYEFPNPQEHKYPIVSVAIKSSKMDEYFVFGMKGFDKHKSKYLCAYKECIDEIEVLTTLIKIIKKTSPDIMIGWNSSGFDFPYIINRTKKILGETTAKKLSPVGKIYAHMQEFNGKEEWRCGIEGVILYDYIELYKKFSMGEEESYSLEFISQKNLGLGKLDHEESLYELWHNDHQKFIEYNIRDTEILEQLEKKLGFINLAQMIAYTTKSNYDDALKTLKIWDTLIYNYLYEKGVVIPDEKNNEGKKFPGGYVMEPKPGIYKNLFSVDLASLYPHVIMQYNISPETIIEGELLKVNQKGIDDSIINKEVVNDTEHILSGNGNFFSKEKEGIFPELMSFLFKKRKVVKDKMLSLKNEDSTKHKDEITKLNASQNAIKVVLNGGYGAMGNKHFRYYDIRLATAVTLSAQLSTKWLMKRLTENQKSLGFKEIVYSDTDSIFISAKESLYKDCQTEREKIDRTLKYYNKIIDPFIKNSYKDLADYMGCNENKMTMKMEKISFYGMWKAKKRYALICSYDEGEIFDVPVLKITGLEIKRSSTPSAIKPYMEESVKQIMQNPEKIDNYVDKVWEDFQKMSPEQIAFPRGVSDVTKWKNGDWYKKGTPIGVRGSILYNKYVGNEEGIEHIYDGAKIKFLYMKQPNIIWNEDVFAFPKKFPTKLVKYIDYKKQFDKSFKNVIKGLCDSCGIEFGVKVVNIDDIF